MEPQKKGLGNITLEMRSVFTNLCQKYSFVFQIFQSGTLWWTLIDIRSVQQTALGIHKARLKYEKMNAWFQME